MRKILGFIQDGEECTGQVDLPSVRECNDVWMKYLNPVSRRGVRNLAVVYGATEISDYLADNSITKVSIEGYLGEHFSKTLFHKLPHVKSVATANNFCFFNPEDCI